MKRHPLFYSPFAPLLLWIDLAGKSFEMMCASAQVIAHRTNRMAVAGSSPSARDRREFALMGQEKLEAGARSTQAMAVEMMTWGATARRDWLRSCWALASFAHSRNASQLIARQAALAQALGQSALGMADAATSASRLTHRGLKPIHARAVANARRLGSR